MTKIIRIISLVFLLLGQQSSAVFGQSRIKDISSFQGMQSHPLIGYGLVVGLDGSGDRSSGSSGAIFTVQSVANMLEKFGITVPAGRLRLRNVAAVMVTASLPAFANVGAHLDVTVSSLGDAKSLEGGVLLTTPLLDTNGELYAIAQGPLSIGGFNIETGEGEKLRQNYTLVGRVPNGGIVQKAMQSLFDVERPLGIMLEKPDFTTSSRIASAINRHFASEIASPVNAATIYVNWPRRVKNSGDLVKFISEIEGLSVVQDRVARVVINERTGTIVAGGEVRISEIMVSHGNLTIHTKRTPVISQPAPFSRRGRTVVDGITSTTVTIDEARNVVINNTVTVSDIASALNQLGVKPRDIIAIFQAIKEAGALQAELVVM
ncbi:MAG: flagellar basal body P-ring protein FlgI [bacterium]